MRTIVRLNPFDVEEAMRRYPRRDVIEAYWMWKKRACVSYARYLLGRDALWFWAW